VIQLLKERQIQAIRYTKTDKLGDQEITERTIIPTFVPKPNIKAIDVSGLSAEDRDELEELVNEYHAYVEQRATGTFKFEDWVAHSKSIHITPKWRTFKLESTEEIC